MRFLDETRLLAVDEMRREGGRRWLRLEVAGLSDGALPGQTVLFWDDNGHSPACRLATVEEIRDGKAALVGKFEDGHAAPEAGVKLTVWSNETPAVSVGPGSLVATTRPFLYRVAPFARLGAAILVEEETRSGLWDELRRHATEGRDWASVFLALEPRRLQSFAASFPDANPYIFANMDMSCGVGACRSCHVNLHDCKEGEPSCRVGPWFALQRVDLARLQFSSAPFV